MGVSTSVLKTNGDAAWRKHLGEVELQSVVFKSDDKLGASETKKGAVVAPHSPASGKDCKNCNPNVEFCAWANVNLDVILGHVCFEQSLARAADEYHTMFSWPDELECWTWHGNYGSIADALIVLLTLSKSFVNQAHES